MKFKTLRRACRFLPGKEMNICWITWMNQLKILLKSVSTIIERLQAQKSQHFFQRVIICYWLIVTSNF